jgi:hypothetical protein
MQLTLIDGSSMIHAVGYDPDTLTLEVQFHNKQGVATATWDYEGVPESLYQEMLAAPSVGSFFLRSIKHIYGPGVKVAG